MNPYRILHQKLTACLRLEAKLTKEEREANEFSLLVRFGDTKMVVLKGGVNTIAYTMGDGERQVCYPDEMLEKLDTLAKREFWYFEVGGRIRFSVGTLLKKPPGKLTRIVGVGENGKKLAYVAKATFDGAEWVPAKGKK
jgi:hypothetical protein